MANNPIPRQEYIRSGTVRSLNVEEELLFQGVPVVPGGGSGGTVDTVQAGTGISVDATDPANPIVSSTVVGTNDAVKVSANDTTAGFLEGKLVAGTNITLTTNNDGGNETLTIDAASGGGGGLTAFTESQNTAAPNNTVNASQLLVVADSADADAVLQPKGSGAVMAQVPNSLASGGNKRGLNAVDWQTGRLNAYEVASGQYSVLGGGRGNTASQQYGTVAGGTGVLNQAQYGSVVGGFGHYVSGTYGFAGGGTNNQPSGSWSSIVGGNQNNASGSYSSIGGGLSNTASGARSHISGGDSGVADGYGQYVHASGKFSSNGDCQYQRHILRREGYGTSAIVLTADGGSPQSSTRITLAINGYYTFRAMITAGIVFSGIDRGGAGFLLEGIVRYQLSTVSFIGTVNKTVLGSTHGSMDANAVANTTNTSLDIECIGTAGESVKWGAVVELMKLGL